MKKIFIPVISLALLTSCTDQLLTRLQNVGNAPPLTPLGQGAAHVVPASLPMPEEQFEPLRKNNSLWQQGSKTFFRDQRARNVGDILKIRIEISDKAAFDNKSQSKRKSGETLAVPSLFGYETSINKFVPGFGNPDPAALLDMSGDSSDSGEGKIDRKETIQTEVAAMVTEVLPNGNLVIYGNQEIRVNFEVRQINIQGLVRPEDISSSNTIESNQIAEARISYGGQGHITDVQQPRLGRQIIDIVSPF